MKQLIFILSLCLFGQITFAQNKNTKRDELLFEKAFLLQELTYEHLNLDEIINSKDTLSIKKEFAKDIKEQILDESIKYYQIIIDSFPKSKLLFRALNNKGLIELELDYRGDAKKTFLKIIDSKANDMEKGGAGEGIMGEPYANYKNRAAKVLANICIKDGHYEDAIKYLDLAQKYPYRHFCGNAYAADEIYMTELYVECYLALKDDKKVLEILMPNIMENGLSDNTKLIKLAYNTLLKQYTKDELKIQFEKAFAEYKIEPVKLNNDDYQGCFIVFLGTKIELLDSWKFIHFQPNEQRKEVEKTCKESTFYKLLSE